MAWKYGTAAANTFNGTAGFDQYNGLGGNDTIRSGGGWRDELKGGYGDDTIIGTKGTNTLVAWGDAGNDTIRSDPFTPNATMYGGDGNDLLDGKNTAYSKLDGGNGNDRLLSGGSDTGLLGGAGNDVLVAQSFGTVSYITNNFVGGSGTDTLHLDCHAKRTIDYGDRYSELVDPIATFEMKQDADGGILYFNSTWDEVSRRYEENEQGRYSSVEKIYNGQTSTATINYIGGFSNMTVTGGTKNDRLESGKGNEVFNGVGGRDAFVFDFSKGNLGVDDINGFTKGVDSIVSLNDDGLTFKQVVVGGHTLVTATNAGGHQVLSLDIDTTGLPAFNTMDHWIV